MSKTINEKIEETKLQITQYKNREKQLMQREKQEERKLRTRRLIERGAIIENLLFVFSDLLGSENKNQRKIIIDLKSATTTFVFLQENNISNLPELHEKINNMRGNFDDEHILQSENYQEYKTIHKKYKEQKPKKQDAFYEKYRAEFMLYNAAEKYLKANLNGHEKIPLPILESRT